MSEFINNKAKKQEQLKALIRRLHEGATVEEVKAEFEQLTVGVSALEITELEQALVHEGMPVEEIQRLCDVHASVFKGSIEAIHAEDGFDPQDFDAGHPVHTLKKENRVIEDWLDNQVLRHLSDLTEYPTPEKKAALLEALKKLATIDKHYTRKEQLIFPYMEKHDITAPPQVMWGVDDEIRSKLKAVLMGMASEDVALRAINQQVREVVQQIQDMIFKEEEIMIPMLLETFSLDEWVAIEKASSEIGYTGLRAVKRWHPKQESVLTSSSSSVVQQPQSLADAIAFDAGALTPEEINAILNTLPLDMTFVGADNKVKYFTQGKERIFDRPLTIIGREVKHCHPPKSVHIVEQIVEDLRHGVKDNEDFWIQLGDQFVYIRYFAVRNSQGDFLGTLEITQNIKPIMALEGEKRLRDADLAKESM